MQGTRETKYQNILAISRLAREGLSLSQIAGRLDLSYGHVQKLAYEYEIPVKKYRQKFGKKLIGRIREELKQGKTLEELGEKYGISARDLANKLEILPGLSNRLRKFNPHDPRSYVCQQIEKCYEKRCYLKEICPVFMR